MQAGEKALLQSWGPRSRPSPALVRGSFLPRPAFRGPQAPHGSCIQDVEAPSAHEAKSRWPFINPRVREASSTCAWKPPGP